MLLRLAVVVHLLICLAIAPAFAREEILSFDSIIEVQNDGSVVVTENIRVRAEGRKIKRGIYRDIPVYTVGPLGDRRSGGFNLESVKRDGASEPHHTERVNEDVRIYMGSASVYLQSGIYTYTIRYRLENQVGFFADYDEIYWNVTGTRWNFPINQVTARIVTPEGAKIRQNAAYTGYRGQTGQDYKVVVITDRIAEFSTTRTLSTGEGITVSTGWPKGFVTEPPVSTQATRWLFNNMGLLGLFLGVFGVPFYYYRTWLRVGRDPEKGIIIPLFEPPEGLSPAAVSYVHFMNLASAGRGASKALIAALVSLAVKGVVHIDEDDDDTVSVRVANRNAGSLPHGERAFFDSLFGASEQFDFNKHNAARYATARSRFRSSLLGEHRDVFFKNNRGYFIVGVVLTVLTVIGFFFLQQPPEEQIGVTIATAVGSLVGAIFLTVGYQVYKRPSAGLLIKIVGFVQLVVGASILAVLAWVFISLERHYIVPGLIITAMLLSMVVFYNALRTPTPVGRKVMDKIEGYKLYLSVAEAERMNMPGAPDLSEQVFEKHLPYAVALGVEKPWSDAFAHHMAQLVPHERQSRYRPSWYSGRSWDSSSIGRSTEGMVSSMAGSMAAATPSSSGSGSGGGGSSGGGGGGGGGGGW